MPAASGSVLSFGPTVALNSIYGGQRGQKNEPEQDGHADGHVCIKFARTARVSLDDPDAADGAGIRNRSHWHARSQVDVTILVEIEVVGQNAAVA